MAIDRPTFSEEWHRVRDLRPRLRSGVQVYRQHFRGDLWHVLRDEAGGKFFRVSDPAYALLALLDGTRTVAEAWALTGERLGDRAPTQGETITLLGQLHTSNLLTGENNPDTRAIFDRYTKRVNREIRSYLSNLLFLRIPIFDPNRLLDRLVGPLGWLFGPVGLALWLVLILAGLWSIAGRAGELVDGASRVLALQNVVPLYVALVITKAIHELGHGICCKRVAQEEHAPGNVHTIGVMLLVLIPVPYVDASSASGFRSKWRRAFVGAAGMYTEFMAAAVAAMVWANTGHESFLNQVAYNAMFVASVSTLLFNANPLIRFDGYYILSDILEVPNLNQRAREHLLQIVKKHVYGVRRLIPSAHTAYERRLFVVYGLASAVYRVFLISSIILFVADQLFFIGPVMALVALCTAFVVPTGKLIAYLAGNAELSRTRPRAIAWTAGGFALIALLVGAVPLPDRPRAEGVVESREFVEVRAPVDGFLVGVAPTGMPADPARTFVARLENAELEARLISKRAMLRTAQAELDAARGSERAYAQALAEQVFAVAEEVAYLERRLAELEVPAPAPGTWTRAQIEDHPGRFIQQGTLLGTIARPNDLIVRAVPAQSIGPRLRAEGVDRAELRVHGRPDTELDATVEVIRPAATRQLPSPALAATAGGSIPVAPDSNQQQGLRTESGIFEVIVGVDPAVSEGVLSPGQRVVLRFDMGTAPFAEQAWRWLRQLLQRRLEV